MAFPWAELWAELTMVRCACGVKVKNRFTCNELSERVGADDVITVAQQNRLRW